MIHVKIRKKPDRAAYQLYYIDPLTGLEKTKSAKTDRIREAERAAQQWEDELRQNGPAANPSWEIFRARFMDEVAIHQRPATKRQHQAAFKWWETLAGRPKYLSAITPTDISKFQAELAKQVAFHTVLKTLRHLRAAFAWAESMGMIGRAPKIKMPKQSKRKFARARAVTDAEYLAMVKAIPDVRPDDADDFKRLLELIRLSGFRLEESMTLSWSSAPIQVDLDGGSYPRVIFHADGQKSDSDELWIMPPDLAAWLRKTPAAKRQGTVAPVMSPGISSDRVSHIISDIGKAAQVLTAPGKWASAHDIRRAFGRRWAMLVRPYTLQRLMRHACIETTLKYYLDIGASDVGDELWGKETVPPNVPNPAHANEKPKRTTRKKKLEKHQ